MMITGWTSQVCKRVDSDLPLFFLPSMKIFAKLQNKIHKYKFFKIKLLTTYQQVINNPGVDKNSFKNLDISNIHLQTLSHTHIYTNVYNVRCPIS